MTRISLLKSLILFTGSAFWSSSMLMLPTTLLVLDVALAQNNTGGGGGDGTSGGGGGGSGNTTSGDVGGGGNTTSGGGGGNTTSGGGGGGNTTTGGGGADTTTGGDTNGTDAPLREPSDGCWSNTTEIFLNLNKQPPFSRNEYHLCANTVFTVGFSVDNICCQDGDLPLVARVNTHFVCGDDGSSKNNCTLLGGTMQAMVDEIVFEEETTDVLFQGLTFQSAGNYVTLPSSQGNVTFTDCIFKNNSLGVLLMLHTPRPKSGRRKLLHDKKEALRGLDPLTKLDFLTSDEYLANVLEMVEDYKDRRHLLDYYEEPGMVKSKGDERDMQSAVNPNDYLTELICNFVDCQFNNNRQGILTSMEPRNTMNFYGTLFYNNNQYGGDYLYPLDGYAIKSDESPLGLYRTCFIDNYFVGAGAVQAFNGSVVDFKDCYGTQYNGLNCQPLLINETDVDSKDCYGTQDYGLTCQFVAMSDTIPEVPTDVTCIDYDATECPFDWQTKVLASEGGDAAATGLATDTPADGGGSTGTTAPAIVPAPWNYGASLSVVLSSAVSSALYFAYFISAAAIICLLS